MLKHLKNIISRQYFIWGLFIGFICLLWYTPAVMRNAVSQTVSRLTPPMNYFKLFVEPQGGYNKERLKDCIYYHDKVAYFFPYQMSQANAMLGFCYARLGKEYKSIESYQRSLAQNAAYFWPYYNLGVIAYKSQKYPQAYMYFRKATEQDLAKSAYNIVTSKVFQDVLKSDRKVHASFNIEQSLKKAYEIAYIGTIVSLLKSEKHSEVLRLALMDLGDKKEDASIYYYYAGLAAFNLKAYDKALILFENAIRTDERNAEGYLYYGLCLQAAGRNDLAQGPLQKAKELHQRYGSFVEPWEKFDVQLF